MNPFRYGLPVPPEELIDREEEAALLLDRAVEGNGTRLVAPRRYGKTSLVRRVQRDAGREGWATVYVDFFGVLTLADIAERVERAYAEQLQGRLGAWFSGVRRMLRPFVRAGAGPVSAGVEVRMDAQAEPPLLERLAIPRRLFDKHGVRTLVVFDEFQDVLATTARADSVMRSEIQHHGPAASYVFAGSHVGMMRALFADKARAFYGSALPLDLVPLRADDVADYVGRRFAETGKDVGAALDPLLDLAEGHPHRTMLLAHELWRATVPGGAAGGEEWATALDAVMHGLADEHRAVWTALTPGQRRVLVAIAEDGRSLYAAQRAHGGSRGGAVAGAAQALLDRGEVVADPARTTGYRLVDPLLAHWVREGRPVA